MTEPLTSYMGKLPLPAGSLEEMQFMEQALRGRANDAIGEIGHELLLVRRVIDGWEITDESPINEDERTAVCFMLDAIRARYVMQCEIDGRDRLSEKAHEQSVADVAEPETPSTELSDPVTVSRRWLAETATELDALSEDLHILVPAIGQAEGIPDATGTLCRIARRCEVGAAEVRIWLKGNGSEHAEAES